MRKQLITICGLSAFLALGACGGSDAGIYECVGDFWSDPFFATDVSSHQVQQLGTFFGRDKASAERSAKIYFQSTYAGKYDQTQPWDVTCEKKEACKCPYSCQGGPYRNNGEGGGGDTCNDTACENKNAWVCEDPGTGLGGSTSGTTVPDPGAIGGGGQ